MKVKLTQNQMDLAQGYDYLYYLSLGEGDWEVTQEWTRPHNMKPIMCDFKLLQKGEEKMLLGSTANARSWVGRKIDSVDGMSMDDMEEYLMQ